MQALFTIPGNILIRFTENKKTRFIYVNPKGNYLAADFEIRTGHPINEMEWNNLIRKSGQKPTDATGEQLDHAKKGVAQRKELLKIRTMADRMQWAHENSPKKTVA